MDEFIDEMPEELLSVATNMQVEPTHDSVEGAEDYIPEKVDESSEMMLVKATLLKRLSEFKFCLTRPLNKTPIKSRSLRRKRSKKSRKINKIKSTDLPPVIDADDIYMGEDTPAVDGKVEPNKELDGSTFIKIGFGDGIENQDEPARQRIDSTSSGFFMIVDKGPFCNTDDGTIFDLSELEIMNEIKVPPTANTPKLPVDCGRESEDAEDPPNMDIEVPVDISLSRSTTLLKTA